MRPFPRTGSVRRLAGESSPNSLPDGFVFFSRFFDAREQRMLLTAALNQLDATENVRVRRLQRDYRNKKPLPDNVSVEGLFFPDEYYTFHKGHYDNVIQHYREMRLSSWPESEFPDLAPVLNRLRALYPSKETQTHLLHLASTGEILPHIDNTSASGEWILGVSLGATRTLRMESLNLAKPDSFDVVLPSGSVYLQRGIVRYSWKHAVLPPAGNGKCEQRISIMIRDTVRKTDVRTPGARDLLSK